MLGQLVEFAIGAGLEAGRIGMLKDQCVGPAAEIARVQGWVSVGRLRTRMGLSLRDARFVLGVACNRGLLYEAVNGRFYPVDSASPTLAPTPTATIFAPLPDECVGVPIDATQERTGRGGRTIVCCGLAAAVVGLGAWGATTLGRREASVPVYHPAVETWAPSPTESATPPAAPPNRTLATLDAEATAISAKLDASPVPISPRAHSSAKHAHERHGHANHAR